MHYNVDMLRLSIWLAKITSLLIKKLNLGNGYTWPGHLVTKIFPGVADLKEVQFKRGVVLVSGTNGKTTTSSLLAHILSCSGSTVAHNNSGANLSNGILTAVLRLLLTCRILRPKIQAAESQAKKRGPLGVPLSQVRQTVVTLPRSTQPLTCQP